MRKNKKRRRRRSWGVVLIKQIFKLRSKLMGSWTRKKLDLSQKM